MKKKKPVSKKNQLVKPEPKDFSRDLSISEEVDQVMQTGGKLAPLGLDKLNFDGYKLRWLGASPAEYTAFSGQANESADESVKDLGPIPQGLYTVNPADIQYLEPDPVWGSHRVKIEPIALTVKRMLDCFKLVRTGFYVHGGDVLGSAGCIELVDDTEETDFFTKLKAYGKKIDLEVKFVGAREKKYEAAACPY